MFVALLAVIVTITRLDQRPAFMAVSIRLCLVNFGLRLIIRHLALSLYVQQTVVLS